MSVLDQLRKQMTDELGKARAISAKAEAEGRSFNDTERNEVKAHFEAAQATKAKIDAENADGDMVKQLNALGLEHGVMASTATEKTAKGRNLSAGRKFTESDAIQQWFKSVAPNGEISASGRVHSPAIQYGGMKDILATGGGTTGAGDLVNSDRLGLIDQGIFERPLTVADLVTGGSTGSDLIEYVREASFTNNAAPVAEAQGVEPYVSGAGQVSGIKPQSAFTLEPDDTKVKTIAHWIPVTKRALSDAAQIRTLIDNFLSYGLREELEDQIVNGSGSGENFEGILNTSGTTAQAWDTNLLVTTRKAKTKVRTVGRATATAFLLSPADNERFDLLTNGNGDFYFGAPQGQQVQTLWGLPRIECEAMPDGTGLVADWRRAILWDREQASIQFSDQHADFFIRNLVAILAELRAAFAVIRPSAFVEIDLTA
jgi:HK97 family phage major capsid protein